MVGEDRFDPRLRLDLSSGKGSLRGLTDSIDHLNKSENIRMLPPRPPYVDPDAPPGVDYVGMVGVPMFSLKAQDGSPPKGAPVMS